MSSTAPSPILNIVLHQPEIPQNTGNIGRTCVAIGARLWMIRPLGFRLDDRYLKRAGMDYWQHLDWQVVDSLDEVRAALPEAQIWKLTKTASRLVWDVSFNAGDILLFGSESRGLPASLLQMLPANNLKLPMSSLVRSLNLASTVNTVAYEAIRQLGGLALGEPNGDPGLPGLSASQGETVTDPEISLSSADTTVRQAQCDAEHD